MEEASPLLKGENTKHPGHRSLARRRNMSRIIAIANQKGGVGKTTTAVNLSAALAHYDQKVLMIDVDPQGNATSGIGIPKERIKLCVYDALINSISVDQIIISSPWERLDIVPASIKLAGAEIELVPTINRETRLKQTLQQVRKNYHYLLIDCPPSLGLLTINALTAADEVLIPIQCEYYALEGLGQLINTVSLVRKHLNEKLTIAGVVLTMYDGRTNLSEQVADEIRKYFKGLVYETVIPRNIRLSEAPSHGQPIIVYDPRCRGSEVYLTLAQEVIGK